MSSVNEHTDLAERLFRFRKRLDLSYREAADLIGIPVATIHGIEKRTIDPRWSTVKKILRAMERNKMIGRPLR